MLVMPLMSGMSARLEPLDFASTATLDVPQLVWQSDELPSEQQRADVTIPWDEFSLPTVGPSYFWKVSLSPSSRCSVSTVRLDLLLADVPRRNTHPWTSVQGGQRDSGAVDRFRGECPLKESKLAGLVAEWVRVLRPMGGIDGLRGIVTSTMRVHFCASASYSPQPEDGNHDAARL